MVVRAVRQAQECAADGDDVFVSTDSEKIRQAAMQCGDVCSELRPAHLATDTASTYDVILHTLESFEKKGKRFSRVVLLQPTSPLRTVADIRQALNVWKPGVDMAVSVCEAKANPYFNAFESDGEGFLHLSKGDGSFTRRQDCPKVWEYNGAVYVMSVEALRRSPMSRFKHILPSPMDAARSVDLDTPADWVLAETLFRHFSPEV